MILVHRYRVKNLNGELRRMARAVNYVFNYCNDVQKQALKWRKKWPTAYDLMKLTSGSSKEMGLSATAINAVCARYAKSRQQHNRPYLHWRTKKSLGWIPVKGCDIKLVGDSFVFMSKTFRVFYSRPLPNDIIKDGTTFSQDARGNWYLNVAIEVEETTPRAAIASVGIDLGLKDFAVLTTGEKISNPRHWDLFESRLAMSHRAGKKRAATKLQSRISNARRDFHHKFSARLVREFDFIAIGDVSASRLARTNMAKSVNDAAWSSFRFMVAYKALRHGATYEEVNERNTTRACSVCGCISGPGGRAGLNKREWTCSDCGSHHDRDTNAATNILLRSGHGSLVQGIAA